MAAAGVVKQDFDKVVDRLIVDGDIKMARAAEIAAELREQRDLRQASGGRAAGKIILLGEHAVVYGKHALAVPIPGAVAAVVSEGEGDGVIDVPDWAFRCHVDDPDNGIAAAVRLIREQLDAADRDFDVTIRSVLPRAMGLGSSAAFAVAVTRAFDAALGLGLDDEYSQSHRIRVREGWRTANPSGVDNTLATFARPMLFRKQRDLTTETIELDEAPPLVVASSGKSGITRELVAEVRDRYEESPRTLRVDIQPGG